ncbi:nitrate- and nitrite sensing domain-containing protein [Streptomyces erythrochromogenes]|uniref:sensor histidine kinase n=1 Tax=Streptomyces erythrochromogenes TaxID=285574 RepID=UPI0036B6733B
MRTYSLHHRRLGTQVAIVLLLPLCLALGLALSWVKDAVERHDITVIAERRAFLAMAAMAVVRSLEDERGALALSRGKITDDVTQRQQETDRAIARFHEAAKRSASDRPLVPRLTRARETLAELPQARKADLTKPGTLTAGVSAYSNVIDTLDTLGVAPGARDQAVSLLSDPGRAVHALAAATAALSAQHALIASAPESVALTDKEAAFLTRQEGQRLYSLRDFRSAAGSLRLAADSTAIDDGCLAEPLARAAGGKRPPREAWLGCSTRALDRMHKTSSTILEHSLRAASGARAGAWRALLVRVTLVTCAMLMSVIVAGVVARRLVRRLQRLHRAALNAQDGLSSLIKAASLTPDSRGFTLDVGPVDLGADDEVGDLTRALDAVVREVVTQTRHEAVARAAVQDRIAALSLRAYALVREQLALLGRLQMSEQDPDALEPLFRLDHLANRMRRHKENMLLLTGAEPGRVHGRDEPLVDVLRAAASETDEFTRAAIVLPVPSIFIKADAVGAVINMLAELVQNATQFSPGDRQVRVSADHIQGDDVVVRVHDDGIGIPFERLDALNASLQGGLTADWRESGGIGLYVVSRLATHLGAQVSLGSVGRGTDVAIRLPAALTTAMPAERPQEYLRVRPHP